jgi:hypothetical protein
LGYTWLTALGLLLASCGPAPHLMPRPSPSATVAPEQVLPSPIVLASPLEADRVSLVSILADAKAWHGKPVRVGGYMHLEFEGNQLCLHRDDVEFLVQTNCVWLDVPPHQLTGINDRYVALEGVVDAAKRGHLGRYQATIGRVTSIGALPTRAALDRALQDERP